MDSGIVVFQKKVWRDNRRKLNNVNYRRNLFFRSRTLKRIHIFLITFIIMTFVSMSAFAEIERVNAEAAANRLEYCSNDVSKEILDGQTITSTLNIADAGEIADLDVRINIDHMWVSDLRVSLISPDGKRVELFSYVGHDEGQLDDTILDDEASASITSGSSPFNGSYRPEGHLSDFDGKSMTGTWKLEVSDDYSPDEGTLNSWCLLIEKVPDEPIIAPVIQSEPTVQGGICNKVSWYMPDSTQEYQSDSSENIPGNGKKTLTQFVYDFGIIEDLNVMINIRHGWVGELDAYLIAPDGTRIELFTAVGGSSDDFQNTIFDSSAPQSIADGTGPFTGYFRPEGNLDNLIGKEIHGTWTLEITDNGWNSVGTLESWSIIAEIANVLYKVQCSTASNFSNIIDESGWIMDNSYTFDGLDPNQVYWFRVKARPLETWYQTSQSDFQQDTLTNTIATNDGDVEIDVDNAGEVTNQEVDVILDPSFETGIDWGVAFTSPFIDLALFPRSTWWASDKNWSAGVVFDYDYYYSSGDYARLMQIVNWTGVDTLMFDYACAGYGADTQLSVAIGGHEVWSKRGDEALSNIRAHYDQTIDVLNFNGLQELSLKVQSQTDGWFDAFIFWDNLRTYRSELPENVSRSIISTPISINANDVWDIMTFNATTPAGTDLTIDILPASGSTSISGYSNTLDGTDLSAISQKTIRLRANLSTSTASVTPMLHDWLVSYTNAALESRWSNVVSSQCN
jgi:subtilisin-like proprotein convertase family protein